MVNQSQLCKTKRERLLLITCIMAKSQNSATIFHTRSIENWQYFFECSRVDANMKYLINESNYSIMKNFVCGNYTLFRETNTFSGCKLEYEVNKLENQVNIYFSQ